MRSLIDEIQAIRREAADKAAMHEEKARRFSTGALRPAGADEESAEARELRGLMYAHVSREQAEAQRLVVAAMDRLLRAAGFDPEAMDAPAETMTATMRLAR